MNVYYNSKKLRLLAQTTQINTECEICNGLICPGWESLPVTLNPHLLELIGSLKGDEPEPTWNEYHPNGTDIWSRDAPIAVKHYPYNRCDIYQCQKCTRVYLQYTEYGGYYVDKRIRALNLDLITDDD